MRSDEDQNAKLLQEYSALAPTYDQRWPAYIDASLSITLEKVVGLPADNVLDVACGTGQLLQRLAQRLPHAKLVGIDLVPAMLKAARQTLGQRATFIEGEAGRLPFDDACFELLVSSNALHYFQDIDATLREFRRVISADGNLVITDWCRDYFWMKVLNRLLPWTRHAHAQTFSSNELVSSLSQAGFRVRCLSRRKIDWFWGLMTVHATPIIV